MATTDTPPHPASTNLLQASPVSATPSESTTPPSPATMTHVTAFRSTVIKATRSSGVSVASPVSLAGEGASSSATKTSSVMLPVTTSAPCSPCCHSDMQDDTTTVTVPMTRGRNTRKEMKEPHGRKSLLQGKTERIPRCPKNGASCLAHLLIRRYAMGDGVQWHMACHRFEATERTQYGNIAKRG